MPSSRAPVPHANHAELRHGRHIASVELEDASVPGRRRIEIALEQSQVAEAAERFDVIGNELQNLLARRGGLIVFAFLDADLGERDQGLRKRRVLASGAFEDER